MFYQRLVKLCWCVSKCSTKLHKFDKFDVCNCKNECVEIEKAYVAHVCNLKKQYCCMFRSITSTYLRPNKLRTARRACHVWRCAALRTHPHWAGMSSAAAGGRTRRPSSCTLRRCASVALCCKLCSFVSGQLCSFYQMNGLPFKTEFPNCFKEWPSCLTLKINETQFHKLDQYGMQRSRRA